MPPYRMAAAGLLFGQDNGVTAHSIRLRNSCLRLDLWTYPSTGIGPSTNRVTGLVGIEPRFKRQIKLKIRNQKSDVVKCRSKFEYIRFSVFACCVTDILWHPASLRYISTNAE